VSEGKKSSPRAEIPDLKNRKEKCRSGGKESKIKKGRQEGNLSLSQVSEQRGKTSGRRQMRISTTGTALEKREQVCFTKEGGGVPLLLGAGPEGQNSVGEKESSFTIQRREEKKGVQKHMGRKMPEKGSLPITSGRF